MEEYNSFLRSRRGCMVEAASIFLTICVLMTISTAYKNHSDYFSCFGRLGTGFPVSFLCDYTGGGSPLSSAGKIDLADFPFISLQGFFVDILFYFVLLWIPWLIRYGIYHQGLYRHENYRWVIVISIVYIACFLSAFLLFQANRMNIRVPPTPAPLKPTPTASVKGQETFPALTSRHVSLGKGEFLVGIEVGRKGAFSACHLLKVFQLFTAYG